ncbi:hypothetical protein BDR07DRAFT_766875 [Suillus spraguei]|nr:hypothetical protein BDR07DRAFT_766875 [Suillus spraguei]
MLLEEILKSGKVYSLSRSRIRWGFMVGMETPHQLHCLNLLRKSSWADCYEPADIPFQDMSEDFRMHLGSYFFI